jgi:hypothetical protein
MNNIINIFVSLYSTLVESIFVTTIVVTLVIVIKAFGLAEGFYRLFFVTDVLNSFLVFSIIGSLGRKGLLKRIPIKTSSYSGVLILKPRREYLLIK